MPLTIRPAVSADTAVLIDFNLRLAEESEGKVLDRDLVAAGIAAGLADRAKARYFVAEDGSAVLGQVMVTTEWSDWRNGWFWWIQSVYVRKEVRRQGVFRALYRHVYEAARQDPDAIGLRLYVERENHAARQTYAALGMEPTPYLVLERYPLIDS